MCEAPSTVECTQTASRQWAWGAGRRRRADGVFHGDRALVREDESSGAGVGVVAPRRECTSCHCTVHVKAVKTVHVTLYIFTPIKNTEKVYGILFSATSPIFHPMCIVGGLDVVDIWKNIYMKWTVAEDDNPVSPMAAWPSCTCQRVPRRKASPSLKSPDYVSTT